MITLFLVILVIKTRDCNVTLSAFALCIVGDGFESISNIELSKDIKSYTLCCFVKYAT